MTPREIHLDQNGLVIRYGDNKIKGALWNDITIHKATRSSISVCINQAIFNIDSELIGLHNWESFTESLTHYLDVSLDQYMPLLQQNFWHLIKKIFKIN